MNNDLLLPYQKKIIDDEKTQFIIIEKSRRIGISWAIAGYSALYASSTNGNNTYYMCQNKDTAQTFIQDAAWWSREVYKKVAFELKEDVFDNERDINIFNIRFSSGNFIKAMSSNPANFRSKGKPGEIYIIDEAAHHPDFKALFKAAAALVTWGCRIIMLSSHNGDLNPFNDLIKKFRAKESALHKVYRIEFKEAIEQGLYKRICQVKGEEWNKDKQQEWIEQIYEFYGDDASEELDVIPKSGSGVFLTRSQIEAVMENSIPVVRLEEKNDFSEQSLISRKQKIEAWCEDYLNSIILNFRRDRATYLGMDFARSNDLTVLWFIQETNDLRLETILVVELRNIPHANQSQILNYIVHRLPKFSAGALDGTGIGNAVAESARDEFGKSIESIIFGAQTNTFYRELMPKFLAYFQDRNITIPKDKEIMEDLRLIRLEKGIARIPNERTKDKLGNQRHGDAAMALILAVHAVKNISTLSYDWMPAKQEFNYKNERRENFMKQSFDDDYAFMIDDRGRL